MGYKAESSTGSTAPERSISNRRIINVKRQTNSLAKQLQSQLNALALVNGELAKFAEDQTFSAKKISLELQKESLEAKIKDLQRQFDLSRTVFSGYLEKNSRLSTL